MRTGVKILQIVYSLDVEGPGGGITRFASDLSRELAALSFDVSLCGLWDYGTEFERKQQIKLEQSGVQSFTAADWTGHSLTRGFLSSTRVLLERQRRESYNLIHSHSEFSDIAALLVGLASPGVQLLRTVHYGYGLEWRRRPLRRYLFTNLLIPLRFSREIGVSPQIVSALDHRPLARFLGSPGIYLPNALDLERFSEPANFAGTPAALKRSLDIPEEAQVIGSIGRLTEQKGYDILLAAASEVLSERPQALFLIIGEGEQRAHLEEIAARLGIQDRVRMPGSRPDIEQILGIMNLFVSSSRWEGLPTVIMESMASGLPVVATDIPGNRELVQPNISGWLALPENPQDLANKILQALQADQQRAAFIKGGREIVQAYSIKNIARKYADLYRTISRQK